MDGGEWDDLYEANVYGIGRRQSEPQINNRADGNPTTNIPFIT